MHNNIHFHYATNILWFDVVYTTFKCFLALEHRNAFNEELLKTTLSVMRQVIVYSWTFTIHERTCPSIWTFKVLKFILYESRLKTTRTDIKTITGKTFPCSRTVLSGVKNFMQDWLFTKSLPNMLLGNNNCLQQWCMWWQKVITKIYKGKWTRLNILRLLRI